MSDDELDHRLDNYLEFYNKSRLNKEEYNDQNEEDDVEDNTFKMIIPPKEINKDNVYNNSNKIGALHNNPYHIASNSDVDVAKLIKVINKKI